MRKFLSAALLALLAGVPQLWAARTVDVPQGTAIQIRLSDRIDSEQSRSGDQFRAILDEDIREGNYVVARAGDEVLGKLVRVKNNNEKEGDLVEMTLTELRSGNANYNLDTNNIIVKTRTESGNKDATMIGGGAGVGAVIGAIAGGVKGAIIGAAVGAGAGAAAVLITDDKDVKFDPEQKFRFYLEKDVDMAVLTDSPTYSRSSENDDSPYLRSGSGSQQDDDGRTSDRNRSDRDTIGMNTDSIRQAASNLDERADHVWGVVRDDSQFTRSSGDSRESEDRIALYMAFSNFANSTEIFRNMISNNRDMDLRAGALAIVRQAEGIDQMMRNVNTFGHLQDDWSQVQREVERLASGADVAYNHGSTIMRAE